MTYRIARLPMTLSQAEGDSLLLF